MSKRKRWRNIASESDLDKVKVGSMIRNSKTGEEFQVMKVNGTTDGVLQVEMRLLNGTQTFQYQDGKWIFA